MPREISGIGAGIDWATEVVLRSADGVLLAAAKEVVARSSQLVRDALESDDRAQTATDVPGASAAALMLALQYAEECCESEEPDLSTPLRATLCVDLDERQQNFIYQAAGAPMWLEKRARRWLGSGTALFAAAHALQMPTLCRLVAAAIAEALVALSNEDAAEAGGQWAALVAGQPAAVCEALVQQTLAFAAEDGAAALRLLGGAPSEVLAVLAACEDLWGPFDGILADAEWDAREASQCALVGLRAEREASRFLVKLRAGTTAEELLRLAQSAPNVAKLDLSRTPQIDAAAFAVLPSFTKLCDLVADGCDVDDAAVAHLANMPTLARLSLASCNITDASFPILAALPVLDYLHLGHAAAFTDAGVNMLVGGGSAPPSQLSFLSVPFCEQLTDAAFARVDQLPRISTFNLSHCTKITDATCAVFSRCPGLLTLNLTGCTGLTAAGVAKLEALEDLMMLHLGQLEDTDVEDAVPRLRAALPACMIEC